MANGKVPGFRRPSKKEVRELLKLGWVRDEDLSDRNTEARLLPDGRVLLYWEFDGTGALYPSRESLVKMRREGAEFAEKARIPPAVTLLPPIDDFLRDVELHANSLGPRLKIPADVLDLTPESLDHVDKALKKIPWAKRQVPDLVTPLVAYLGEVMRKGTGGQWAKAPTTRKRRVEVFDPAEMAAWAPIYHAAALAANEAAKKAGAEARARRASKGDVASAINAALFAPNEADKTKPKPIRIDEIEEPITGNENEPLITTRTGGLFQPFASVYLPMVEPSRRIPLRSSPGVPHRPPSKPAA